MSDLGFLDIGTNLTKTSELYLKEKHLSHKLELPFIQYVDNNLQPT